MVCFVARGFSRAEHFVCCSLFWFAANSYEQSCSYRKSYDKFFMFHSARGMDAQLAYTQLTEYRAEHWLMLLYKFNSILCLFVYFMYLGLCIGVCFRFCAQWHRIFSLNYFNDWTKLISNGKCPFIVLIWQAKEQSANVLFADEIFANKFVGCTTSSMDWLWNISQGIPLPQQHWKDALLLPFIDRFRIDFFLPFYFISTRKWNVMCNGMTLNQQHLLRK